MIEAQIDISGMIQQSVAKYLQRSCPKCNGYLGIVVPAQAINGRCLKCGYRLAWVLVRGGNISSYDDLPRRLSIESKYKSTIQPMTCTGAKLNV